MTPSSPGTPTRCAWAESSDAMRAYHDQEWGVASHDDAHLFEMLVLEGAQAGLSWSTILAKRENYRTAFDGFDPRRIVGYDEDKIASLLADPGIVRNRLKVRGTVSKDLKRRDFTFVGTTILYSFLQAVGVVDDHVVGCPAKRSG